MIRSGASGSTGACKSCGRNLPGDRQALFQKALRLRVAAHEEPQLARVRETPASGCGTKLRAGAGKRFDRCLVPEPEKATISVFDRAVQWGDAVYDAARTFNHRPFKVPEHIERLYRSCRYTRMPISMSPEEMEKITVEIIDRNMPLLAPNDDDMIWWSVTRGVNPVTR